MPNSLSNVSLQPQKFDNERLPLDQQIARVTKERGSFAKLEGRLLQPEDTEEHKSSADTDSSVEPGEHQMDVDGSDEANPHTSKPDQRVPGGPDVNDQAQFADQRRKLSSKIATAVNEAALNLDFVSLLVSALRPQAGNSSLSPMLRSQTPNGSLNAETVRSSAPSMPASASYGWKIKKYAEASTKLADAASRLQTEASMEAKFWQDVLNATSHGEVINRKLQIKYGYRDSGSRFEDRGIGKIERSASGDAEFHGSNTHGSTADSAKLVQVSVYTDQHIDSEVLNGLGSSAATPEPEKLLGRSTVPYLFTLESHPPLLKSIWLERNNLFELELMQQLIHEARWELASYKVKLLGEKIVCELFGGRIEIQLVDCGANGSQEEDIDEVRFPSSSKAWGPAQAVNYYLHLLLVQQLHDNFEATHSKPSPLSSNYKSPQGVGSQAILKPVLAKVQHGILVSRILNLIHVMLPQATVKCETNRTFLSPVCKISIESCEVAYLEVASPITDNETPIILAFTGDKKAGIYDLGELELWLKWTLGSKE